MQSSQDLRSGAPIEGRSPNTGNSSRRQFTPEFKVDRAASPTWEESKTFQLGSANRQVRVKAIRTVRNQTTNQREDASATKLRDYGSSDTATPKSLPQQHSYTSLHSPKEQQVSILSPAIKSEESPKKNVSDVKIDNILSSIASSSNMVNLSKCL